MSTGAIVGGVLVLQSRRTLALSLIDAGRAERKPGCVEFSLLKDLSDGFLFFQRRCLLRYACHPRNATRIARSIVTDSLSAGMAAAGPAGVVTAPIVMLKFCVALGAVPLEAVVVPLKVPAVVGGPLITPAALKLSPGGKLPAVTLKVGEPVDV